MNVLLVPAHPDFPGQIPQSRKTVVVLCCVFDYLPFWCFNGGMFGSWIHIWGGVICGISGRLRFLFITYDRM